MSARVASQRHTRPKKLGLKQNVPIFREHEIELIEVDPRSSSAIETGVEAAEQNEYHLVAAINAAQQGVGTQDGKDAYIPTPPTVDSSIPYDALYPKRFQQPATYIRSSATVEDCAGNWYCMDEEDAIGLTKINARYKDAPCSEDQFEEVMAFFEETARNKQPFSAVDNPPVLSLADLEEQIDDTVEPSVRKWAKVIYEHWRSRRTSSRNQNIQPILKFETSPDTDDADPYVCFRRREVRQIRKTRGRDAQSAEKLRRLRKELEDARTLVAMVRQRELARKESLVLERQLFKQRGEFKEMKRKLNIEGDDEDLVNQKPKKKADVAPAQQAAAPQLRLPVPRIGISDDLRMLDDVQAEKEKLISREIQQNVEKHIKWNEGFVDKTRAPLTPVSEKAFGSDFRQAIPTTEYLPTPPASISEEQSNEAGPDLSPSHRSPDPFRYATPPAEDLNQSMPSFRRRLGRGGRFLIDRRMPHRSKDNGTADAVSERFKYDSDDDEVDEIIDVDPYDLSIMTHRGFLFAKSNAAVDQSRRMAEAQAHAAASQSSAGASQLPSAQAVA